MRFFILLLSLGFFMLMACGGTQPSVNTDDGVRIVEQPKDSEWNEDFDPLSLGDGRVDIDSQKRSDDVVDIDQILRSGAGDTTSARAQIRGFRVQLISTRTEEEARSVMRNAAISFNQPVYREYDNPYYKIRVGDFLSRYEASNVQAEAIELGFHEAWVVRAMVWDRPAPQVEAGEASEL
jgi:hypothetical protein